MARSVEVRIAPMASYAPGLEDLYIEMVSRIDQLDGRDFSYVVNTGRGPSRASLWLRSCSAS